MISGCTARLADAWLCRGRCDPAIPSNMGKLMRSHIVRSLRQNNGPASMQAGVPEVNICCNGREAADEVWLMANTAIAHACMYQHVPS